MRGAIKWFVQLVSFLKSLKIQNLYQLLAEEKCLKEKAKDINTELIYRLEKARKLCSSLGQVQYLNLDLDLDLVQLRCQDLAGYLEKAQSIYWDYYLYAGLKRAIAMDLDHYYSLVLRLSQVQCQHLELERKLFSDLLQSLEFVVYEKRELKKLLLSLLKLQHHKIEKEESDISLILNSISLVPQFLDALLVSHSDAHGKQEKLMARLANSSETYEEMVAHFREFKYSLLKQKYSQFLGLQLWRETFQLCKGMLVLRVQNVLSPAPEKIK